MSEQGERLEEKIRGTNIVFDPQNNEPHEKINLSELINVEVQEMEKLDAFQKTN